LFHNKAQLNSLKNQERLYEQLIKYIGAAIALKMFSLSPITKRMYSIMGDTVGDRIRSKAGLPKSYIDRAKWILQLFEQYNISQENANFLELGTGWVHWESTVLRLFNNGKFTLYDVCDNRRFRAFKTYFSDYYKVFNDETAILPNKRGEARDLLEKIISIDSFNQLYDLLGFQYIVDPSGTLLNLKHEAFDACFSYNVFEHIDKAIVPSYIKKLHKLLKPGGFSIEAIDISDHLVQYDRVVCPKNYMKYSDAIWKICFENDVQYFNRIQRGEWLSLFSQAGFVLEEEESLFQPIDTKINNQYINLDRKDIDCTALKIVHRKR
jgi:hypothetical protein